MMQMLDALHKKIHEPGAEIEKGSRPLYARARGYYDQQASELTVAISMFRISVIGLPAIILSKINHF
jgi:hypothetical protein